MLKQAAQYLRRNPLDFKTAKGPTIGELIFSHIDESPVLIDVGARNGMSMFPASFAGRSTIVGFEPNPEEYAKLASSSTDAAALGAHLPDFRSSEYHPVAIWSEKGERTFFITAGPGACTLLGEPLDVTKDMYLDSVSRRTISYFDVATRVVKTTTVQCDTLDNIISAGRTVDFLKLDVEGGEVECLKGASRLLNDHDILFVYSEFQTLPYYNKHGVLGDQHAMLNSLQYRLLDLDLGHPTYRRGKRDMSETADRRLFMSGDAIFCVDPDRVHMTPNKLQRLAAVSMSFGFVSFALSLLENAGLNTEGEIDQIEKAASSAWTFQRMRRAWQRAPKMIGRMI